MRRLEARTTLSNPAVGRRLGGPLCMCPPKAAIPIIFYNIKQYKWLTDRCSISVVTIPMSNPRHIIRGSPKARIVQNLVGLSGLPAKFVLPVLLAAIGRGLSRIVRGFLLPWLVIFAISASAQTNFYVATNG